MDDSLTVTGSNVVITRNGKNESYVELIRYFAIPQASGCDFALSPPLLTAVTT